MQLRKNGINNIMKPKSLTLEEYIIFNNIFEGIESDNTILEGKLDFLSNIDNDMLTISCKYCDIKINVQKSKLDLYIGNINKPSIELSGKDFVQFVELKGSIDKPESLADARDIIKSDDFDQNINFLKKFFSKYANEIQKAIKDASKIDDKTKNIVDGKDDKLKFEWKLLLDDCQLWPPDSGKYDDSVKLYLNFSLSLGCVAELSGKDLTNASTIVKAIIRTYTTNNGGMLNSDSPMSLQIKDFVFDGMKFTELVKTFKSVFANGNTNSLVEILKAIPEVVFGMPSSNNKNNSEAKKFIIQLKQVIKKSIPELKKLKEKSK